MLYGIFLTLFLLLAFILCAVILIQESKGMGGLGGLAGGDTQDSLFGVSTAQVIKKFTAWMVAGFLFLCTLLSFWTSSIGEKMPAKPRVEQHAQK